MSFLTLRSRRPVIVRRSSEIKQSRAFSPLVEAHLGLAPFSSRCDRRRVGARTRIGPETSNAFYQSTTNEAVRPACFWSSWRNLLMSRMTNCRPFCFKMLSAVSSPNSLVTASR